MKLRRPLPLPAAIVLAATACVPLANFARDVVDTSDGAVLAYLERTPEHPPGLTIDPGPETALGAILIVRGDELELLSAPEGVTCTAEPTLIDCRFGDVDARTFAYLTGLDVVASLTYRREGSSTVYQTFAR